MYDIITFGSAAQDIHVKSKEFKILEDEKDFATGKGICLPFGSKIDVEDIIFTSGGGGTNTAATFAKQGFKTAFCGSIGVDSAGLEIIRELRRLRVDARFLVKKKERQTNCSIVISSTGQDRTILVYRGASELLCEDDIPWKKLKARWFYLAPLADSLPASPKPDGGGGCGNFENIVNFAHENKINIAVNPSKQQLSMPIEDLKRIFSKIDILFLNQEEASHLTKIPMHLSKETTAPISKEIGAGPSTQEDLSAAVFKKIDEICPGIAVMTKGGEGVVASDGKYLYSARPDSNRKIVDTTGAGDSFAAGFLADFIRHNGNIEKAIQLGLANSAANLSEIGAKTGLLDKNSKFEKVQVLKEECDNNKCEIKYERP